MKRLHYLLTGLFFLSFLAVSCIEDTSMLAAPDELPEVSVDTTGMEKLSVLQFEELLVEPKVETNGVNEGDLSYEWKVNVEPRDTLFSVIGTEKVLRYEARLLPTNADDPYQLVFTVTDETTGLDYITQWPLQVRNSLGEGLVVAHTRDEARTELSLIMAPQVTPEYQEVTVKQDVYSSMNGQLIEGLVKDIQYTSFFGVPSLLGITDESIVQIKRQDFTFEGKNEELFFAHSGNFQPQMLGKINQGTIYVGNNKFTGTYLGASKKLGAAFDAPFTVPDEVALNGRAAVPVAINFYDEENGHFVYLPTIMSFGDNQMHANPGSSSGPFNPGSLTGKENLAAGVASGGDFRHVLRDKETGGVALYTLDASATPTTAKAMYDMSDAPQIAEAKYFVIPDNQQVVYYATDTKIYAMLYGASDPIFEERFTVDAGQEITTLQVYQQTGYPRSDSYIATNNRQLILSTYDGSEGKVHLLPITNLGVGNIDEANIVTFEGMGRITSIAPQE